MGWGLPCHLDQTLGKGSMGALAVTKSAQLLDTAPLVILLVRLPHNVMASVSLCFPRQERERGGAAFPALLGSLRCGEAHHSKKTPQGKIQCKAFSASHLSKLVTLNKTKTKFSPGGSHRFILTTVWHTVPTNMWSIPDICHRWYPWEKNM